MQLPVRPRRTRIAAPSSAGWGNSYTGVDWLLTHATPAWTVRLFRPAMLAQNQDVFVLERVA